MRGLDHDRMYDTTGSPGQLRGSEKEESRSHQQQQKGITLSRATRAREP
jgi:hypothetical protein